MPKKSLQFYVFWLKYRFQYRGIAKLVRHQVLILAFRRFESCIPSHDPLAQSAEHLTFNQGVPRSSRGWVTILYFSNIRRGVRAV